MSITHHVVTTKMSTIGVYVLQCDRCGAFDCAKCVDIFIHRHVHFGWRVRTDGGDICPRCVGFVDGLNAPRSAPEGER